jgi:hypothetical protein
MALGQQQPVIPSVFDQPSTRLHRPLLQAGQRPVVNPLMLMFLLFCHASKKRAATRRTSYPQNYERRWVFEGYQSVKPWAGGSLAAIFGRKKEGWGLVLSSLW